jgi:Zn-dependent metalloprotease
MSETSHPCTPYVCSIVPTHLLRAISQSENASPAARESASRALAKTLHIHTLRAEMAANLSVVTGFGGGVVPPHILSRVAQSDELGPDAQDAARRTLETSQILQVQREAVTESLVTEKVSREVYDAETTEDLPGKKVREEGQPLSKDKAVNECYDSLGYTFDLYAKAFERNSINNRGMDLIGSVHYGQDFGNAMWDGYQMVFGDGDGHIFKVGKFTELVDVIGHELTHGVTQYTANLRYQGESGALNESISDVFGSILKQYHLKQTPHEADWLIGEGIWADTIKGVALRSMKEPGTAYDDPQLGKDPQPGHMKNFDHGSDDNGEVHINSGIFPLGCADLGIPNKAFYLVATGLGGHSWEKPGKIWYGTLTDRRLRYNATFKQFATLTVEVAEKLYDTKVSEIVQKAWVEVGVLDSDKNN